MGETEITGYEIVLFEVAFELGSLLYDIPTSKVSYTFTGRYVLVVSMSGRYSWWFDYSKKHIDF